MFRLDFLSKFLIFSGVLYVEKEIKEVLILNKFFLIIDRFIIFFID